MEDNVSAGALPTTEFLDGRQRQRRRAANEDTRQLRGDGNTTERRFVLFLFVQITIEPTVRCALDPRGADLHVILSVKVRARIIRRSRGVDDGKMTFVVDALKRRQRGVERVEAIEIDSSIFPRRRLRDGDALPERVVSAVLEGNDGVQSIHGAALKNHHQGFAAADLLRLSRPHQKRRRQAQSEKS